MPSLQANALTQFVDSPGRLSVCTQRLLPVLSRQIVSNQTQAVWQVIIRLIQQLHAAVLQTCHLKSALATAEVLSDLVQALKACETGRACLSSGRTGMLFMWALPTQLPSVHSC